MHEPEFRPSLTLTGTRIELVPLAREQLAALAEAGRDPGIWRYIRSGSAATDAEMRAFIDLLLERQLTGSDVAFAVQLRASHAPIGMTRYLRINRPDRGVEIGGTWYAPAYWRTPVNTEAKYLLLRHAFEVEGVQRVQIQTDSRNLRSQRAIERLGAKFEGRMRRDVLMPDGAWRDSMVYSIVEPEWPEVRRELEAKLARPWPPAREPGSPV